MTQSNSAPSNLTRSTPLNSSKTSVGIVDYGRGNLTSVRNAIQAIGGNAQVIGDPANIDNISHLILPGVGAFGEAMERLHHSGWVSALHAHAMVRRRPLLGICLGMQLLMESGTEHGIHAGLGWIAGTVSKLTSTSDCRVPHIGWNDVELVTNSPLLVGLNTREDFYFVHSYAVRPTNESCVTGWCQQGERFAATLQQENLFATQFHPEKSQRAGLRLLENFLAC